MLQERCNVGRRRNIEFIDAHYPRIAYIFRAKKAVQFKRDSVGFRIVLDRHVEIRLKVRFVEDHEQYNSQTTRIGRTYLVE